LRVSVASDQSLEIAGVGEKFEEGSAIVLAPGDKVRSLRVFVTAPPHASSSAVFPLTFALEDVDGGEAAVARTTFLTEERS
jgi:hypothetical protein